MNVDPASPICQRSWPFLSGRPRSTKQAIGLWKTVVLDFQNTVKSALRCHLWDKAKVVF